MKHIHIVIAAFAVALLCGSCSSNAPKYESILEEVLSCMVPDKDDDIHLVEENVKTLKEILAYHCRFEKASRVKDLRGYFYPIEDNFMFQSSDGVEAMKLEKDIYGPAVDSLCTYVEEGGKYPAETILKAVYHLQDQFARAMGIDPQIGIGAAIWLNRFTQQTVQYCPDRQWYGNRPSLGYHALDKHWVTECPRDYNTYIGFSNDGSRYVLIDGSKAAATEGPLYNTIN